MLQDVFNLLWHFNCLLFQLAGNFWLLKVVDVKLFGENNQIISLLTAVTWIIYLLTPKGCPLSVKVCSSLSVVLAYWLVPHVSIEDIHYIVFPIFGIIWVVLVLTKGFVVKDDAPLILLLLLLKLGLAYWLPASPLAGLLTDNVQLVGVFP